MAAAQTPYDAVLVLSFGGPEGPDDVVPFLERVLAGRAVPRARLEEVAGHYLGFGGVSPINAQNRALVAALRAELDARHVALPVYLANRNWHPLVADTVGAMAADGVQRALVWVTSTFGSYSGCRQYLEDLAAARAAVGPEAPILDKLRLGFNHPGFITAVAEGLASTLAGAGRDAAVLFSAHSIPTAMAAGSPYVEQLNDAAGLVAGRCGVGAWELAWQSRSGPPSQPWLEPDVVERALALGSDARTVVVCPIGFVSDHMEVVYDLDTEAAAAAEAAGVRLLRSPTAGLHPAFVAMIGELVEERLDPSLPRRSVGALPPWPDVCPAGCCPPPSRPAAP